MIFWQRALLCLALMLVASCGQNSKIPRASKGQAVAVEGPIFYHSTEGRLTLSAKRDRFRLESRVELQNVGANNQPDLCCGPGVGMQDGVIYQGAYPEGEILCLLPRRKLYFKWSSERQKKLEGKPGEMYLAIANFLQIPQVEDTLERLLRDPEEQAKEKAGENFRWRKVGPKVIEIETAEVTTKNLKRTTYERIAWDPTTNLCLRYSIGTGGEKEVAWPDIPFLPIVDFNAKPVAEEPELNPDPLADYREIFPDSHLEGLRLKTSAHPDWKVKEEVESFVLVFHRRYLASNQLGPWLYRKETWHKDDKEIEVLWAKPTASKGFKKSRLLPYGPISGVSRWDDSARIGEASHYQKDDQYATLSWVQAGQLQQIQAPKSFSFEQLHKIASEFGS